jgi:hypothetical protein
MRGEACSGLPPQLPGRLDLLQGSRPTHRRRSVKYECYDAAGSGPPPPVPRSPLS